MPVMDFDSISRLTRIPSHARMLLEKAEKEMRMTLNLRTGADSLVQTDCYLVCFNTARGPAKGGIRMSTDVSLEETADLAERMVWKTALAGVPFGGGKSGIRLDSTKLDRVQRAEIIKEFVHIIRGELDAGSYIPAPDLGTNASDMAVIFGETHKAETVTGKPPRVGGLPGRKEATGRGVACACELAAAAFLGKGIGECTVAVQGFGNVGSWAASFLHERGAKVLAVSDVRGGVFCGEGLDVPALLESGDIFSAAGAEKIDNAGVLSADADVLVPAAVGEVLDEVTAGKVLAKVIVEGANGPTTPAGDEVFRRKGIVTVPDVLANAGGVTASYVEWRKARSGSLTERSETFEIVDSLMGTSFARVLERSRRDKVDMRTASHLLAVEEVVKTMEDRGWL